MNFDANQGKVYLPIAPWSGRLILPLLQQRRQDGGVYLYVENAPTSYAHLKGKTVWLCWHPQSIHQKWLSRATIDIKFDQVTRKSQSKNMIHPTRLDGWQRVSPLESLAGARPNDDVQVELDVMAAAQEGNEWIISINDEPIQVAGILKGLVRFVAPVGENHYRIRHYNSNSQSFDGPEEIASLPDAGVVNPGFQVEQSSIKNIENLPLNASGWYIYGYQPITSSLGQRDCTFVVQGLEPAEALRLTPTQMVIGRAETQAHVNENKWKQMPLRRVAVTLVDNNGKAIALQERTPDFLQQRTKELWLRGDEALVVHTFGWRGGRRGNAPPLGIAPGHFSFGFAKLVRDEFTGALRFSLIYRQVYAHNSQGIVSGAHRWHSYMGNLKRGWMYTLPVSDVMVRLPELTVAYKMGEQIFNPLDVLKQELAFMEARYRIGNGNGASIVTPATSCVKDSNQALFAAIRRFQNDVIRRPAVRQWLEDHPDDYHTKRFLGLQALLKRVEDKVLFPLGYVPPSWRGENEEVAAHDRDRTNLSMVLEGLKTWRTLLPRRAERELLSVFRDYGATMVDYQSALIGGEISGIVPLPPGVL